MAAYILKSKVKWWLFSSLLIAAYILFLIHFYRTYVPLIPSFQAALGPCLFITFVLTIAKIEWGLLAFIFFFPLINFLPYVFRIYEEIPHAPTSLVLFLFFLLSWGAKRAFSKDKSFFVSHPLHPFLASYLILISISGLITFLRFGNFYPLLTTSLPELVVNVNGVRAGGARMSTLFSSLNLASGVLFSLILWPYLKGKDFRKKSFITLYISFFISLIFGLFQLVTSSPWGRLPGWLFLKQIQSSYKDPNSFAFFLAAFFPLLTAAFMARKKWRLPAGLSLGLCFFCLLASGTRSAFLASLSGIIFFLIVSIKSLNLRARKKVILALSVSIIIFSLFISLYLFSSMTLSKRLNESWAWLRAGLINQLFSNKTILWKTALSMFFNYPLTGVGIGAYIVELPNYLQEKRLGLIPVDSAENVIFQITAELGLAGLIFVVLLFIKFLKEACGRWSLITNQREKIIAAGGAGSLVACLVNFLFHSYIGSFEIKFLFWLLASLFLTILMELNPDQQAKPILQSVESKGKLKSIKIVLSIALILFCFLHLSNSLRSLSIPARTAKLGWPQDFGFYQWEKDWRACNFRWAKKEAGISLPVLGPEIGLLLHASHPDIEENPVKIEIYLADRWFKKKNKIYSLEIRDRSWARAVIPIWEELSKEGRRELSWVGYSDQPKGNNFKRKIDSEGINSFELNFSGNLPMFNFVFEASRSWKPMSVLGVPDPRDLAFALAEIWFRYPPLAPLESYEVKKRIPSMQWIGPQGAILAANGSAEMVFSVEEENCLLRLKARGEKALNLGPFINIYLDGKLAAKTLLESNEEELFYLPFKLSTGQHSLKVEFINDFYSPSLGQDRNLFLGDVEILKFNIFR